MNAYHDVEIAIRFLKSIATEDPKTDAEIALVVQRLEALVAGTPQTDGAPHGSGQADGEHDLNRVRYHHDPDDLGRHVEADRRRR